MWVGEPFCLILNDSLLRVEFLVNSTRLFLVLLLLLLQILLRFFLKYSFVCNKYHNV